MLSLLVGSVIKIVSIVASTLTVATIITIPSACPARREDDETLP